MTQKTFNTNLSVSVGDEVILIGYSREGSGTEWFDIRQHSGSGVSGNLDTNQKRYHGWRGTTNGIAKYAYGVRKVTKVLDLGEDDFGEKVYKVTVSKDIHPDWD